MQTIEFAIEDIITAHPNLYLEHCAVMAVALMSRQSTSFCEFALQCESIGLPGLKGDSELLLRVTWNDLTAFKARRAWNTEQPNSIVERAAVALAALIFARFVPNGRMRVTKYGERADYWLPDLQCALEISGTTQSRLLPRRHREKVAQVLSNPLQWSGFVVTCCFARRQHLIRWSYHQQGEKKDGRA